MAYDPYEVIRLPQIPTELRSIIVVDTAAERRAADQAGYKQCYGAFVNAKVPCVRIGSGWGMYRRDLPVLAAHFGLRLRDAAPSAPNTARADSASPSSNLAASAV